MKWLAAAVIVAIGFAVISGSQRDSGNEDTTSNGTTTQATTAQAAEPTDRCLDVSAATLELIGVEGNAAAVKTDIPGGPLDLPQNNPNYYVAVDTSEGPAVWATDADAFAGKSGLVFAADDTARQVSNAGDQVDVTSMGIGPGDADYAMAKRCL